RRPLHSSQKISRLAHRRGTRAPIYYGTARAPFGENRLVRLESPGPSKAVSCSAVDPVLEFVAAIRGAKLAAAAMYRALADAMPSFEGAVAARNLAEDELAHAARLRRLLPGA